jgi:hypothetical protein
MSNKTTTLVDKLILLRRNIEIMKSALYEHDDENVTDIQTKFNKVLQSIEKKLKCECKHEYIEDYIDIDPDTSKCITYCSICECTF